MDYKKLESELKKITDLVDKIPEKYKDRTFEMLFAKVLDEKIDCDTVTITTNSSIVIPVEVKGLLKKHTIKENSLEKIFFIENKQAVPIYELPTDKKATSQIQLSLLIALENALNQKEGKLEFSIENVRQGCKDRKCFDSKNFATTFNLKKDLFVSLDDSEHVGLSKNGRDELAKTIQELI